MAARRACVHRSQVTKQRAEPTLHLYHGTSSGVVPEGVLMFEHQWQLCHLLALGINLENDHRLQLRWLLLKWVVHASEKRVEPVL